MSYQETSKPILRTLVALMALLLAGSGGALTGAWVGITTPDPGAAADGVNVPAAAPGQAPAETVMRLETPLTIALLGIDYNGAGRRRTTDGDRTRTDTIILARIDPGSRRISALSVPRDTRMELPGHGYDKVNAANVYGGLPLVKQTLSQFLGVPIDRHLLINLAGAEQLMEAVGGVDLDVERAFHYDDSAGNLHIHLRPGMQHLAARDALAYARFRHDSQGDLGRVARQQRMLHAVADTLFRPQNLLKLPQLVSIASTHVSTDLTAWELTRLIGSAPELWRQDVRWGTVPGAYAMRGGVSYWEPDMAGTGTVVAKLFSDLPETSGTGSRVLLLDALGDAGVSAALVADLTRAGFGVAGVRRVSSRDYPVTQIIDRRSDNQAERMAALKRLVRPEQTRVGDPGIEEPLSGDYVVVIGPHYHNR